MEESPNQPENEEERESEIIDGERNEEEREPQQVARLHKRARKQMPEGIIPRRSTRLQNKRKNGKAYTVFVGRQPGVYDTWEEASNQRICTHHVHIKTTLKWKLEDDDPRLPHIEKAGFGWVRQLTSFNCDQDLLKLFYSRFRPDTCTFSLGGKKYIISLEDVACLTGLSVDGQAIIWKENKDIYTLCRNVLGRKLTLEGCDSSAIKFKWLRDTFEELEDGATEDDVKFFAKAYILYLLGTFVLPNNSGSNVPGIYLTLLEDFEGIRRLSWGSSMLALLIENLKKDPSKSDVVNLGGNAALLQFPPDLSFLEKHLKLKKSLTNIFHGRIFANYRPNYCPQQFDGVPSCDLTPQLPSLFKVLKKMLHCKGPQHDIDWNEVLPIEIWDARWEHIIGELDFEDTALDGLNVHEEREQFREELDFEDTAPDGLDVHGEREQFREVELLIQDHVTVENGEQSRVRKQRRVRKRGMEPATVDTALPNELDVHEEREQLREVEQQHLTEELQSRVRGQEQSRVRKRRMAQAKATFVPRRSIRLQTKRGNEE
ncbi:hypothetical protein RHGRI_012721 [Rhododendron griersonianum]|uniref:Aminotransferase-like plant mobile domain-containing protein n=1 Tax=Rhododendron griersonianum TaxID=479676 RepID=A0AAV6KRN5_9ERIC|nr:hypothetical protein RHGRI_012721 [Rhododendron griersonianum]